MIKQEHNLAEIKDQKPEALTEPEIKVSEYKAPVNPADDEFRAMWRAEGGEFPWHPYSGAGRMPEDKLLTLMRELVALRAASAAQTKIAQSEKAMAKTNEQPMRDLSDVLKQRVSEELMKTAQAVYEDYEKTGVLALPQDEAKISGRGSTSPGLMDITFADGSTLILSVTRYLTGFAAGRESVHISWADGDE